MVWTPFTRADHARNGLRYASDMTEREWQLIAPFMPPQPSRGRKRTTDFPAAIIDTLIAIRWIKSKAATYGIDPNRIGLWGSSAGWTCPVLVERFSLYLGHVCFEYDERFVAQRRMPPDRIVEPVDVSAKGVFAGCLVWKLARQINSDLMVLNTVSIMELS